jgi:hypothetical protein
MELRLYGVTAVLKADADDAVLAALLDAEALNSLVNVDAVLLLVLATPSAPDVKDGNVTGDDIIVLVFVVVLLGLGVDIPVALLAVVVTLLRLPTSHGLGGDGMDDIIDCEMNDYKLD